jgi:hypothetical protein
MKLEWGRKVNCPTCSIFFYDMQKTSLHCPGCGSDFEKADLNKKNSSITDVAIDIDDKGVISGFSLEGNNMDEFGISDDEDLSMKTEMDDMEDEE